MMIVLFVLGLITGAVLLQFNTAQQRISTEEVKLDNFDEARDFVDQFFRDINQIGYPNTRMVDFTTWASPPANPVTDQRFAVGLVKIDANEIRFEGDVNGTGTVESLIYMVNGSTTCGLCLQRSQADKQAGDPLTGQTPNWGTEVNDVVNTQIFTYFDTNGNKITTLPADIDTLGTKAILATVKTIQVSLTIRNNSVIDPKTGQPIETNFEGEVSLNNCSMAAPGQPMSCQ